MSRTVEIQREQWFGYLEGLARRANGYPVSVELDSEEVGEKQLASKAPLFGIELEKKGSEADDVEIVVSAGGGMLEHHIEKPTRIYVLENEAGNLECLEIEDSEGGKTLVFFERLPGLPANASESHEELPIGP